jgi:hypothetical protein
MAAKNPLWSATRLNAELAKHNGAALAFTPYGDVVPLNPNAKQAPLPSTETSVHQQGEPTAVAEVAFLRIGGIETVQANVALMPPLLACLAIDPEPWSIVIIHPDAVDLVGPFRDVSSPIRDWLLRAFRLGRTIGSSFLSDPSHWKTTRFKGFGIFESLPLETAQPSTLPRFPLPELVATAQPNSAWLSTHLEFFDAGQLGGEVKSRDEAVALAAGLWQVNGFLEQSHELAQSVEGKCKERAGDYWHAIMHRREPDYSNAKYWFRRVGPHGIHKFLARDAAAILAACPSTEARRWQAILTGNSEEKWNPFVFVDLCEQVDKSGDEELLLAARQIQLVEMVLLLKSTHHYTFY